MKPRFCAWLWMSTLENLGIEKVLQIAEGYHLTDIFLLTKSVSGRVFIDKLREVAKRFADHGLGLHSWIVCFEDMSRPRVSPEDVEYRRYLLKIIEDVASIDGVRGVHLDYVRYRGNAYNRWFYVSWFVAEVKDIVSGYNIELSAATKAEAYSSLEEVYLSALYYGQNYRDLAKYIDVFVPMTYYLDYNVKPRDAVRGAFFVKLLTNKPTLVGVQLHEGEHPLTRGLKPSPEEVTEHIRLLRVYSLDGVSFFRFALLTNYSPEMLRV